MSKVCTLVLLSVSDQGYHNAEGGVFIIYCPTIHLNQRMLKRFLRRQFRAISLNLTKYSKKIFNKQMENHYKKMGIEGKYSTK